LGRFDKCATRRAGLEQRPFSEAECRTIGADHPNHRPDRRHHLKSPPTDRVKT
jgi:hypothetical protein